MRIETGDQIHIQKNRGWRGLAQVVITSKTGVEHLTNVFSFSQDMWADMLHGYIVVQDKEYYYILTFDNTSALPRPNQQRSVLIKNFTGNIIEISFIKKSNWTSTSGIAYSLLLHYVKNKNNHTTSDWNYIRNKSDTKYIIKIIN